MPEKSERNNVRKKEDSSRPTFQLKETKQRNGVNNSQLRSILERLDTVNHSSCHDPADQSELAALLTPSPHKYRFGEYERGLRKGLPCSVCSMKTNNPQSLPSLSSSPHVAIIAGCWCGAIVELHHLLHLLPSKIILFNLNWMMFFFQPLMFEMNIFQVEARQAPHL